MQHPTRIRLHIWLESEDGVVFGMGRMQLLERVEELGSLKAAAESLGMSYRAAWGKLKQTERLVGQPLVEKPGGDKAGYRLTDYGRTLTDGFRQWFAAVESQAARLAGVYLPMSARPYVHPMLETLTADRCAEIER